jgi:ribosomal protein L44E
MLMMFNMNLDREKILVYEQERKTQQSEMQSLKQRLSRECEKFSGLHSPRFSGEKSSSREEEK